MAKAETRGPKTAKSSTDTFGRFRIERLLGEGGFASVYLSLDPKLNRRVALKVPKPAMLESSEAKTRFEREARAAAMLSHPSIVPVFECGELNGQNYIASAYCPGQTLASWIRRQPGPNDFHTAAQIIAELAEAVGYAHQRGIVHRDLKPANVLIDGEDSTIPEPEYKHAEETQTIAPSTKRDDAKLAQDETATILPGQDDTVPSLRVDSAHHANTREAEVDNQSILGRLRITDFGLAKSMSENQELTIEGTIMGTPSYMSPEQASGRSDVGPESDIFTLGTMLFELVAGKVPFRRDSAINTMMAISEEPLPSLGSFRKSAPRDLDAICQMSMRKDPAARYASAFDFAADLNAWIEGRPIKARVVGPIEKFTKLCKRNPGITTAIAAALLSLTIGLAATTWSWQRSEANLARANYEFTRAEENLVKAEKAAEKERKARNSAEQVAIFMTGVFRSPDPTVKGKDVKVIDILHDAEQRLDSDFGEDPIVRLELMLAIARCYLQLGEYRDSIEIVEEAEQFLTGHVADDMYLKLKIRDMLANGWVETRQLDKAIDVFNENLALAAELEGSDSPIYVKTESNLAASLMYKEDFEAALPILEDLIEKIPELEIDPELILRTKNMQAVCFAKLGRRPEAIEMFEEVLDEQRKMLGENHPTCINTANNLAVEYKRNGEPAKAIEQQEDILAQSRVVHGDDHPITIRSLNNLAMSYFTLGDVERATPLFREAHRSCLKKLGEQHINTLSVGLGFAKSLIGEREFEEAIPLLEAARAPLIKRLGLSHPRTMSLLDSLGNAYAQIGQPAEAIGAFEDMLQGIDRESELAYYQAIEATIVRMMIKDGKSDQAEQRASKMLDSVNDATDASQFGKAVSNLTVGLAKCHNSKMDQAGEFLEYVLSHSNQLTGFSADEKAVIEELLETLIEELGAIDSDDALFDPAKWLTVLDSMQ